MRNWFINWYLTSTEYFLLRYMKQKSCFDSYALECYCFIMTLCNNNWIANCSFDPTIEACWWLYHKIKPEVLKDQTSIPYRRDYRLKNISKFFSAQEKCCAQHWDKMELWLIPRRYQKLLYKWYHTSSSALVFVVWVIDMQQSLFILMVRWQQYLQNFADITFLSFDDSPTKSSETIWDGLLPLQFSRVL